MDNTKRTPCQIYSRVCGWYTERSNMNVGKQAERKDMKTYNIKKDE